MSLRWTDISFAVTFEDRHQSGLQKLRNAFKHTPKKKKEEGPEAEAAPPPSEGSGTNLKLLLKGIWGFARPGELVCIIGTSGAGKSTLLNVIAHRMRTGFVCGDVFVGPYPPQQTVKAMKRFAGYVLQNEVLLETLTAYETLYYQAKLTKTPVDRVEEILRLLHIWSSRKTLVQNLSGGQRKRLAIAMELLSDPSILLLDEPTSGLDAWSAQSVMDLLRKLAHEENRCVIATIHQPSSQIFQLFDKLILLHEGRMVYFGPADKAADFFGGIGYPVPAYTNPADHLVFVIQKADPRILQQQYETSLVGKQMKDMDRLVAEGNAARRAALADAVGTAAAAHGSFGSHRSLELKYFGTEIRRVNPFLQTLYLTEREFHAIRREQVATTARFFQTVVISLVVGLLYLGLGTDQTSIQNRAGALYFVVVNNVFAAAGNVIFVFPKHKLIFLREFSSGFYKTLPYFLGKNISELPFQLIFPVLFAGICYYMVGFQPAFYKFLVFIGILILVAQAGTAFGYAISASSPNAEIAMTVFPVLMLPIMVLGGLFLNSATVPKYFYEFKYISPVLYGFDAMLHNEFSGLVLHCTSSQLVSGVCPVTNGSQVLSLYGVEFSLGASLALLGALLIGFRVVGFIGLKLSASGLRGRKEPTTIPRKVLVDAAAKQDKNRFAMEDVDTAAAAAATTTTTATATTTPTTTTTTTASATASATIPAAAVAGGGAAGGGGDGGETPAALVGSTVVPSALDKV